MSHQNRVLAGVVGAGLALGALGVAGAAPAQAAPYERDVYFSSLWDCWNKPKPGYLREATLVWDCHFLLNVNGGSWTKTYRMRGGGGTF